MAKIITVNIPKAWLEPIGMLVGKDSLYVSRSELIRKAIEDRLATFIDDAKNNTKPTHIAEFKSETEEENIRRFVRVSQEREIVRALMKSMREKSKKPLD